MKSVDSQVKLRTFTAVLMLNFPDFYLFNFAQKKNKKKQKKKEMEIKLPSHLCI